MRQTEGYRDTKNPHKVFRLKRSVDGSKEASHCSLFRRLLIASNRLAAVSLLSRYLKEPNEIHSLARCERGGKVHKESAIRGTAPC